MTTQVLVTGAGGQLGTDCVLRYRDRSVIGATRAQLDVGDRGAVQQAISDARPDIVINAGAWTAVDDCEADPGRAMRDNADSVRYLNAACLSVGAHLVHLSTDYVFDGTKTSPYVESDEPNPQSVYGSSKLAGELEVDARFTIVRTSWVCGEYGNNMVKTILRAIDKYPRLSFVDDQRGHPTFTADLAKTLRLLADERVAGLFHVTNAGPVSWYEFTQEVLLAAGEDPSRVDAISTEELDPPRPAPRPANSVLENAELKTQGIELLRDFREPLGELVAKLRAGPAR